jgi:hypothetical protein
LSADHDIDGWPDGIQLLSLAIEVNQARAWAEGVRRRDGRDAAFDQRQLELRLHSVRRLLISLEPHGSNAMVAAAQGFANALAERGDKPPEGPWPESEHLIDVVRTELRAGLRPAPIDGEDWARRTEDLAKRSWIGGHAGSCPAGWLPLLERAVSEAEHWVGSAALENCRTSQIKEKFGTLRWYLGSNEPLSVIVDFAELTSECTCLACGAEGRLRTDRMWLLTLCDAHDELDRGDDRHALSRLAYPDVRK